MRQGAIISGKYHILRKIGEGGMGSVWVARNEMTDREFAIKFMSAELAQSHALTARFLQEAKVAGRLRHPSLLEIFDAGVAEEFGGAPFLVMELLDGIALDAAIAKAHRLPVGIALEVMCTVARAMSVVHDKGIIHRDLKPANVFMHRPGTGAILPKVLDFGISKVTANDGTMKPTGLTQTGHVLGSPIYMSPEQASSDKTIDARSDVHALGVLLWECLVGLPPFRGESYNSLVVEIMVNERPRLESVMPEAPKPLADIVARAFALHREDRFQTARDLAAALDQEMDRLGHRPVLDSRDGASHFFALLGRTDGITAAAASSTTSAHAIPARSELAAPPVPRGGPLSSAPNLAIEQSSTRVPRSPWLIPLGIGATSVFVVVAATLAWRWMAPPAPAPIVQEPALSSPPPAVTEDAAATTPSSTAIELAPGASSSAPTTSAAPPHVTVPSVPAPTPSRTTTPSTPTPAKSARPPAHHGVEDDGL